MADSRCKDEDGLPGENDHVSPALLALVGRLRDETWQPLSRELETTRDWVSWEFRNCATF